MGLEKPCALVCVYAWCTILYHCLHSLMDRALASGAGDVGSIPAGGTIDPRTYTR